MLITLLSPEFLRTLIVSCYPQTLLHVSFMEFEMELSFNKIQASTFHPKQDCVDPILCCNIAFNFNCVPVKIMRWSKFY